MSSPPMLLVDVNGAQAWRDGGRIVIGYARSGWAPTLRFVAGLVTFILAVNAVVIMATTQSVAAGLGLGLAAVAAGALTVWAHRKVESSDPAPPARLELILDLDARALLAADGTPLASLDACSCHRAFQLGSSARKLVLRWPNGERTVARGNPFGSTVDAMEELLRRHGVRRG